jgi:ectoine hydroxylase-related dioxygenase (phytanoyl-CoA dioxygenase family)
MGIEPHLKQAITRVVPSEAERAAGRLWADKIEQVSQRFRIDGALIIEDIVDSAIISAARRAFSESYSGYLDGSQHEDTLLTGRRRVIITIELRPPFDDPSLFANPYLIPILNGLLDDGFVIGAFGIVCSLAQAPAQDRHDDGATLFPGSGIDRVLPPAAITVGIPLIEMNSIHVTTELWLGSHRDPNRGSTAEGIEPVVRPGSCVFWDFRLLHRGTANQSITPRPLLYLTYCRPWFVDHLNFTRKKNPKQRPLLAGRSFLSGLPENHQRLLVRAQET